MLNQNSPDLDLNRLVLKPGEGHIVPLLSNTVTNKLSSDDSDGQLTVIEYEVAPNGPMPPPHRHTYVELFYMLSGELLFQVGDRSVTGSAGTTVIVPAGVVHTYKNETPEPARYLVVCSPAGLDNYFVELGDYIQAEPTWPPKDMSAVAALNQKYDTEVVVSTVALK